MKQHIESKDLELLTEEGKQRLRDWCAGREGIKQGVRNLSTTGGIYFDAKDGTHPLLSIGQMIEFLGSYSMGSRLELEYLFENLSRGIESDIFGDDPEMLRVMCFCEELWQACVVVLNG
jgi:hypothetical protein